jgi:hypothetical protein
VKIRAAIAVAALGAAALATSAGAAPKKSCNLAPDPKGDVVATQASEATKTPDAALDLVMGDVGSSKTTVTGVIRLDKLAVPASTSPGGTVYEIRVGTLSSDSDYTLWANVTSAGATFGVGTVDATTPADLVNSTGTATGVVDTAKSEIRISAPLTALGSPKLGSPLSISDVVVKRSAGNQYYGRFADSQGGGTSYKLGTPTCVPVGK